VLVGAASIGLLVYNMSLQSTEKNLREKIVAKNAEITEVSNDRKVIITKILQSDTIRPTLDLKGIIANFRDAASRANVRLKGFQISKDVISTSLIATVGNTVHPDPASTIITMMRNYASVKGDGRFTLEPITSIS
jgi:hypothetical protein